MERTFFVVCSCNERHATDEVEVLDVEEDFQGADVVTFSCPNLNEIYKSRVYAG